MARRANNLRYEVTGPGLDEPPTYEGIGQALSRSLTAACEASKRDADGTWYVRDSLDKGKVMGYSETSDDGKLIVTVAHPKR